MRVVLLILACLWALPAQAGWLVAETQHFRVFTQDNARVAVQRAALLEDFRQLLVTMTARELPDDLPKLDVYLVRDVADVPFGYRRGSSVAGFYQATPGGIVAVVSSGSAGAVGVQSVLLHEVAHHFMFADTRVAYPAWYVEGFAEFFQTASFSPDRIDFGRPDENRVRWLLYGQWVAPDAVLSGAAAQSNPAMFYAQSWVLTHWLYSTPERLAMLQAYLARTAEGADPVEAFQAEVEPNLRSINGRLQAYIRNRGEFHFRRFRRQPMAPASVTVTALPAAAERLLLPLLAVEQGLGPEAGAKILATVRAEAARHGDDPFARRALAAVELFHGETDTAIALLDPLIAASPADPTLLRWRGLAALDGADDPRPGRQFFVRAFNADPADWRTLMAYVSTFPPGALDDNGLAVLERGWTLAPQVSHLSFMLARALAERGRLAEIPPVLRPVAWSPHGGKRAALAQTMIELAQSNDQQRLLQAFVSGTPDAEEAAEPEAPPGPSQAR